MCQSHYLQHRLELLRGEYRIRRQYLQLLGCSTIGTTGEAVLGGFCLGDMVVVGLWCEASAKKPDLSALRLEWPLENNIR